jgi:hypothetical protein
MLHSCHIRFEAHTYHRKLAGGWVYTGDCGTGLGMLCGISIRNYDRMLILHAPFRIIHPCSSAFCIIYLPLVVSASRWTLKLNPVCRLSDICDPIPTLFTFSIFKNWICSMKWTLFSIVTLFTLPDSIELFVQLFTEMMCYLAHCLRS